MSDKNADPVDMVAIARENALADALLSRPGMLKVIAPAKVNLFLSIGGTRNDGMHEALNVMHTVMLHDVVFVRCQPASIGSGRSISVACMGRDGVEPPAIEPEQNIAYRAAAQLAEACGRGADESVEIVIEKHIPHQAGLGGGSSDAAATLAGLAHLWGLAPDDEAVLDVARTLGSDVPFFLHGGCALFEGAGERFAKSIEPRRGSLVIVKPSTGLSTAAVYRAFDEKPYVIGKSTVAEAVRAEQAGGVPLENGLAAAAERLMPELGRIRTWLEAQDGVLSALLCGSGSSTFALCTDFATASGVAAQARAQGWWARATSFTSARATPIPS